MATLELVVGSATAKFCLESTLRVAQVVFADGVSPRGTEPLDGSEWAFLIGEKGVASSVPVFGMTAISTLLCPRECEGEF